MSFPRTSRHLNLKQPDTKKNSPLYKIVSGGQTGVDRAALDVAIKLNIPHGGWCPRGRKAEDGVIASHYHLTETESDDYNVRTKLNIRDSDGTLILVPTTPIKVTDGTILTINEAKEKLKPHLIIDISIDTNYSGIVSSWVTDNNINILNLAGPRESQSAGIYTTSFKLLSEIFQQLYNNHEKANTNKFMI